MDLENTKLEEELLADKMQDRLFLLKIASSLYSGMTVSEFNRRFGSMDQETLSRYLRLMYITRKQFAEIEERHRRGA